MSLTITLFALGLYITGYFFYRCLIIYSKYRDFWTDLIYTLRWFIVGKYTCPLSETQKKLVFVIHKCFWGSIIIGWSLILADIIEFARDYM